MFKFNKISILALLTGLFSGVVSMLLVVNAQMSFVIIPGLVFGIFTSWFVVYEDKKTVNAVIWIVLSTIIHSANWWLGFALTAFGPDEWTSGFGGSGFTYVLIIPGIIGAILVMLSARKIFHFNNSSELQVAALLGALTVAISIGIGQGSIASVWMLYILWQSVIAYLIGCGMSSRISSTVTQQP